MFILLFENNKWKIYLSASTTNSKVFVCEFYDGQLAQNKVDELNDQLFDIFTKYHISLI